MSGIRNYEDRHFWVHLSGTLRSKMVCSKVNQGPEDVFKRSSEGKILVIDEICQ